MPQPLEVAALLKLAATNVLFPTRGSTNGMTGQTAFPKLPDPLLRSRRLRIVSSGFNIGNSAGL
ncbi:MAG: hypothetical protein ACKPJJ_24375, partial [Planctomycetaceae bacterium]